MNFCGGQPRFAREAPFSAEKSEDPYVQSDINWSRVLRERFRLDSPDQCGLNALAARTQTILFGDYTPPRHRGVQGIIQDGPAPIQLDYKFSDSKFNL